MLDNKTVTWGLPQEDLAFFVNAGYIMFDAQTCPYPLSANWVSPNRTLVWGAPSMWIERTPILLAQRLGLLARAGLPPLELRIYDGGPELLAAVDRSEVQIGEIGLFPFAKHAADRIVEHVEDPVHVGARLVGNTFIQQLDHYLVGKRKDAANHQGLECIREKTVGVLSQGSCDSYLLRCALKASRMPDDSVEAVALGAHYGKSDVLKYVDAAFLVEPALSQAESFGRLGETSDGDGHGDDSAQVLFKASSLFPRFQWGALFASEAILSDSFRPELLKILNVYEEAVSLMQQAVEGRAPHLLDAVLAIGPECFGVRPEIFHKALLRDAATWQLNWRNIDYVGAEVCVDIMRELGTLGESSLAAAKLFVELEPGDQCLGSGKDGWVPPARL